MTGKDRLGRGLGALLGEYMNDPISPGPDPAAGSNSIPLAQVAPNPFQPRTDFGREELAELAESIRANGLLQPIVVRPAVGGVGYELVAGERRLRAVSQLGWTEVPAHIRDVDDRMLLVLALVENIQREGLGPLEEATGYGALRDEFGLTQSEIAEAVGKSRSTVANMLRLLSLPPSVRRMLEEGTLSMGHARALLGLGDPTRVADLARRAVSGAWSVRAVEAEVRAQLGNGDGAARRQKGTASPRDPAVAALEDALQAAVGTRATIRWKGGDGAGSIQIPFQGPRDLERVFEIVTGMEAADVVG